MTSAISFRQGGMTMGAACYERSESGMEYRRRTHIPAPAREVFDWHARPGALERLTPPGSALEVVERSGGIESGARVVLRMPVGPLSLRWVAEHTDYVEGELFRDVQVEGPFARWVHTHRFIDAGDGASVLEDHVEYALRFGRLGALLDRPVIRPMLERMFAYRHWITAGDLAAHGRYRALPRQHFLVGGHDDDLANALVPYLTTGGHSAAKIGNLPIVETGSVPCSVVCSAAVVRVASGTRLVDLHLDGSLERDDILDAILHVSMRDDIEGHVEPAQLVATGFILRTRRDDHARS